MSRLVAEDVRDTPAQVYWPILLAYVIFVLVMVMARQRLSLLKEWSDMQREGEIEGEPAPSSISWVPSYNALRVRRRL